VSDHPGADLSLPLGARYGILLVNRFANDISDRDELERLALYAHLVGWSRDEFLWFMSPRASFSVASDDVIHLEPPTPPAGLGYWLAYHRLVLPRAGRDSLLRIAGMAYDTLNVPAATTRLGVQRILSSRPLPQGIMPTGISSGAYGPRYDLSR